MVLSIIGSIHTELLVVVAAAAQGGEELQVHTCVVAEGRCPVNVKRGVGSAHLPPPRGGRLVNESMCPPPCLHPLPSSSTEEHGATARTCDHGHSLESSTCIKRWLMQREGSWFRDIVKGFVGSMSITVHEKKMRARSMDCALFGSVILS